MAFEDITRQLKATDEGLAKARELAARGDFNAAEQLLNKNLNFVVEFYGASSLKTCNVLLDLADVYYAQEKYASVITSLQQVLITNDKEALYSQEELLSIKFKFAKALEHGGNHQDACNFYQSLLNDASTTFGASSRFTRSVAESLNALTRRHSARIKNVEDAQEQASQSDTGKNLIVRYARQSNADGSTASGAYSQQKSFQEIRNFYKDGDPSIPQSGGKTLARRLGPGLTLVAATLLCAGIILSGILTDKTGITGGESTTADSASSARAALDISAGTLPPGSYCTVDGLKSLTIVKEGEAVLYSNGIEAKVPLERCGSEVYLGEGADKKIFRTSRYG
ncbi:MAG TPA: tetratricopeptide repeat protein, partial [Candidatus Melainabacteria bacterium]|nr:tetratricopeptide repeat protein [Candidatus Melainabacteria bacterium]